VHSFFFPRFGVPPPLHSFPTRRSSDLIQTSTRERVDVAPACGELTRAQFAIAGKTGRETILRRAIRDVDYDIALIDTAPELQLRSEEHTSELQSRENLVCRLLLEKKK